MKRLALVWLILAASTALAQGSGGINAPEHRDKPYLILISIDGFRWDFQNLYDTPALDRITADGIKAERVVPVFPTLTFPNHYSIATGLYPANHGIIGNRFPSKDRERFYALSDREAVQDGTWYRGEPVWVAAEKAGMVTAAYYFVGTEADIAGVPMTYWNQYDESITGDERVDQVLEWLALPEDKRPHLVTLYFEDVDSTTHRFGPGSPESIAAISRVDNHLDRLLAGLDKLEFRNDIYLVVVSDHGHIAFIEDEIPFSISSVIDMDGVRIVDHAASNYIYLDSRDTERAKRIRDAINDAWDHGTAYLADETPESWRVSSEAGFADVILVAEPGYAALTRSLAPIPLRSTHGWSPDLPDMHAYFAASGPRLPKGETIGQIHVTDVYSLMMEILGLSITIPIDGDPDRLTQLLE